MNHDETRSKLHIRAAGVTDAAELARLSAQLGYPCEPAAMRQRLERLTARADHAVLVASIDAGALLAGWVHVGAGLWLESGECAEILGLVVDTAARRGGVGRRLIGAAEQWSRAAGFERIVVRSNAVRPEAHAFYPSLGYALEKTQRVYGKALTP